MRRAAVIICSICIVLSAFSCFAAGTLRVFAAEDPTVVIDNMSDADRWASGSGTISYMRYSADTEFLASGEGDTGYIAVRKLDAAPGAPLEVSRAFDTPVDLFAYDELSFYISITDAGAAAPETPQPATEYAVKVTLFSVGPEYTYEGTASDGDWELFTVPVGDYSLRTDIVGISISVTAKTESPADVRLVYRLDGIKAGSLRDTSFEDKFLSSSLSALGGRASYSEDGGYFMLSHSSVGGSVSGYPVIRNRSEYERCDLIRFTVSDTTTVDATLEVTYIRGGVSSAAPVRITGNGVTTAIYFDVGSAWNVYSFTLRIDSVDEGDLCIYGVELIPTLESSSPGAGTLDTCRVLVGGTVNLRGTLPPDFVADHMNGVIAVYCVPVYGEISQYLSEIKPCAEIDMTTRFDIKLPPESLPAGYRAMRFAAAVRYGEELIPIGRPLMASFSDDVGARLPAVSGSAKGLICDDLVGSGAALTVIDVNVNRLFGTASSGRLYSFGSAIYYFDNDYIAKLDEKIKSSSLSGVSCYLRLFGSSMMSADSSEEFSGLYAAVDFLTSRYSTQEYGFVSGIVAGQGITTDRYDASASSEQFALSEARMLSVIYAVGRGNIAGFRVMVPMGSDLAGGRQVCGLDAAGMLRSLSVLMDEFGSIPYDVMIESPSPLGVLESTAAFTGTLTKNAPSGFCVVYAPEDTRGVTAESLLSDYFEIYRRAVPHHGVFGVILSLPSEIEDNEYGDFITYFRLLDTNRHMETDDFAGIEAPEKDERLYPISYIRGYSFIYMRDVAGSYSLFDFTDSFDSAGWFSVSGEGACMTVRTPEGRVLRADAACGGIMYSCAISPLDLSGTPILCFDVYSDEEAEYELSIYSVSGVFTASLPVRGTTSSMYVDLSVFDGVSGITCMTLTPKGGEGSICVSRVSVCSRVLDDEALRQIFEASPSDDVGQGEANMLEILAVSLMALAFGAGVVVIIGYRTREGESQHG